MATESAMSQAGRTSDHTFKDIRSARRARNRSRTYNEKYFHFRRPGLTRADLPSSKNQKAHYLPECSYDFCRNSSANNCPLKAFPADLSTAPVAKFTKREAYDEAQQWPRPPTYHRSHAKDLPKWEKRKHDKACMRWGIENRAWYDDVWDVFGRDWPWDQGLQDLSEWERWDVFGDNKDIYEACDDYDVELDEGYVSGGNDESSGSDDEERKEKQWFWHRNLAGGWFRASVEDHRFWCRCDYPWDAYEEYLNVPEEHFRCNLVAIAKGRLVQDLAKCVESDTENMAMLSDDLGSETDLDWDLVSATSDAYSETWTDVEDDTDFGE